MDELRALRFVIAVAEERHFSRAADRLGVAQPSLSRTIRALEAEKGFVLFDRTSRSVSLTRAGEALVAEARAAIEAADRAIELAQATSDGATGIVRVGFVVGAANAVLASIARELRTIAPGIALEATHYSVAEQIDALRARRLDVALLRQPSDIDAIDSVIGAVIPDRFVAAVPSDDPAPARDDPWAVIRERPFVFWPRAMAPSVYDSVMQRCRTRGGFTPAVISESTDLLARLALVAAGLGVTLVSSGTAAALVRDGVRFVELPDAPEAPITVLHGRRPSPGALAVIEICRKLAA